MVNLNLKDRKKSGNKELWNSGSIIHGIATSFHIFYVFLVLKI